MFLESKQITAIILFVAGIILTSIALGFGLSGAMAANSIKSNNEQESLPIISSPKINPPDESKIIDKDEPYEVTEENVAEDAEENEENMQQDIEQKQTSEQDQEDDSDIYYVPPPEPTIDPDLTDDTDDNITNHDIIESPDSIPPITPQEEPFLEEIPPMTANATPVIRMSISTGRIVPHYKIGDIGTLSIMVFPSNATEKSYSLSTSNPSVVNISQNGQFTCITAGTAIVTATAENGVKREILLTVFDVNTLHIELLELINNERQINGLLTFSSDNLALNSAADIRLQEIATKFSHTRPDGRNHSTAYDDCGGVYNGFYKIMGENIGSGYLSAQDVMSAWMNSPLHRDNILNQHYTHIGISVGVGSNGLLYWVQEFYG